MWKDLGSQWERELIRHEDIPDLKDEDLIHANNKASSELEILPIVGIIIIIIILVIIFLHPRVLVVALPQVVPF